MAKRLFIDLNTCDECDTCTATCAYLYQPEVTDHGIRALRERIAYALVCRRCEEPSCVAACTFDALERQEDGTLKRYALRCVSCKCCSQACPFGTIYPELTPYLTVRCDYCMDRLGEGDPRCVTSCPKGAIEYKEVSQSEKEGIFFIGDHLAVHAPKWKKEDV